MTRARATAAVIVALLVAQILAILVHGVILASDYNPFEGTLLRSQSDGPPWQAVLLPVAHLSFVSALVWVYGRLRLTGSRVKRGLTIGLLGCFVGQVPLWIVWYAQQPWPGALIVKQLGLELLSSLAVGLAISAVADPRRSSALVETAVSH